ncbi:MAG: dihydroorotate dehydrogenase electron transfer subunit [Eubacteriales bacterium]|nr:dihydroorotate dehydrogenase electron transfer subunit [Eubacteriales bacterium]
MCNSDLTAQLSSGHPQAGKHGLDQHLRLVDKSWLNSDTIRLRFESENSLPPSSPGQFYNLETEYFLRRPIGILSQRDRQIDFGIKVIGRGTRALAELELGQKIRALGPLGHGFEIPDDCEHVVICGGGTGIFPLHYLAEHLRDQRKNCRISEAYGFRTEAMLFHAEDFRFQKDCLISCDDGSYGFHGNPVMALEAELGDALAEADLLACCGPWPLMRAAYELAERYKIPSQCSTEARMACGIGLCKGCSIDVYDSAKSGSWKRQRCCYEGPVFRGGEIKWP